MAYLTRAILSDGTRLVLKEAIASGMAMTRRLVLLCRSRVLEVRARCGSRAIRVGRCADPLSNGRNRGLVAQLDEPRRASEQRDARDDQRESEAEHETRAERRR
jgi:hypothetical protein